jgi:hypothetical protein
MGFGGKLPRGYLRSLERDFPPREEFNTYTASAATQFSTKVELNTYTASAATNFTARADFNTYTASNGNGTGNGIFSQSAGGEQLATSSVVFSGSNPSSLILNVEGISELSGGLIHKRFVRTSNYTLTTTDYLIAADTSNGSFTILLPDASTATEGQTWVFKDEGGVAPANNLIIRPSVGGQTIDGKGEIRLESSYAAIHMYTDGISKYFIF